MYTYTPQRIQKKKHGKLPLILGLLLVGFLIVGAALFFSKDKNEQPNSPASQDSTPPEGQPSAKPPVINLQPTVDEWLAGQSADFGIVVYDPANQQTIATNNPDKKYFAASLYKLFVAYLSLVDFQDGRQDPEEILTGGFSRKECVDKMIRESHSPCGEAMMADMGQENLRKRVSEMGIKNTTFAGITTTARDTALILQYLIEMKDLNAENTAFLKDAMRIQDQKFRNGLAKGAPEAVWETKVGWNEQANYHDVGIMALPGGRQYVVAILSQNNGRSTVIADFAATIYDVLKN